MRILPPVEENIRRAIRDARAADPIISVYGLQAILEKQFNHSFSRTYIKKLADKVFREALVTADRTQIAERMNVTREKFRLASERLTQILLSKSAKNEDAIEASKNLAMLDLALLKAEIECGFYKSPGETTPHSEYRAALPEDQRRQILSAFGKWRLLDPGTTAHLTERTMTLHAPATPAGADN